MRSVYDSRSMQATFNLITKWMIALQKNEIDLPSNFDFQFYLKGLTIALDSRTDNGLVATKVIWHIYMIFNWLPLEYKLQIACDLLLRDQYFYRFFFHWSYNVRMVFYYFYFFQLYQTLGGNEQMPNISTKSISTPQQNLMMDVVPDKHKAFNS